MPSQNDLKYLCPNFENWSIRLIGFCLLIIILTNVEFRYQTNID